MESPSKVFRIHFGSRPLPCNVEVSDGIDNVQAKIHDKEGIPPAQLEDGRTRRPVEIGTRINAHM